MKCNIKVKLTKIKYLKTVKIYKITMGIRGLNTFIKKYAQNALQQIK